MSESFINQITLDCLLNKEMYNNHVKKKKVNQQNKEERKFYRKRSFNLFKEMINGNIPEDLLPDVKYAYDNFINATIHYFKTIDNNDIIQSEYKECEFPLQTCSEVIVDLSANLSTNLEADKLLLRSIKIETPTLDKYVKRSYIKKKEEKIILPKQREINLNDPELKNKGLKKNNITNIYEDKNAKKKNEN
jgi:hypothetical protein